MTCESTVRHACGSTDAPMDPVEALQQAVKLMGLAADLTALSAPEDVPARVAEILPAEFGFKAVSVLLLEPRTHQLVYAADQGVPPQVKALGFRAGGATWRVMESGVPFFVEDMAHEPQANPDARPFLQSYAILPIAYRERRLGVLIVNYGSPHRFLDTERQVLRAFASATAAALEKVRLLEDQRLRSERLAALASLGAAFSESMEPSHALDVLDRSLKEQVPRAEAAACWVMDDRGRLGPGFSRGLEPLGVLEPDATKHAERFLRDLTPAEERTWLPQAQVFGTACGEHQVLPLVLRSGQEIKGLLVLWTEEGRRSVRSLDLDFLQALADRTGTALHQAQWFRAARDAASQDSMTGVLNHGTFTTRAREIVLEAQRSGKDAALLMFDADHFKSCNDTYGHLFGDTVLKALAREIRAQVRPTDLVGRWGGEEFTVLLPNVPFEVARAIAERVRSAAERLSLPTPAGEEVGAPTLSGGVASLGGDVETLEQLVNAADQALYAAKSNGRNQVFP